MRTRVASPEYDVVNWNAIVWFAKDNQPSLRTETEELFTADDTTVLGGHVPNDFQVRVKTDKGHGRLEVRKITTSSELKGYSDWPGVEEVFQLDRLRRQPSS